jgi:DNA-binding transcriptional ArsR family regulator
MTEKAAKAESVAERGGAGGVRVVQLDNRQIRTLAHPLRVRLLGTLRADGPATATALARKLDTNTGATSYHLRQLAEVGLVTEEIGRAAGRERWWRSAHDVSSWRPTDFEDDPDASAASDWVQGQGLRLLVEEGERWLASRAGYPRAWREAAGMSDYLLRLTPARLRDLVDELDRVVERYRAEPGADGGGGDGVGDTEQVLVAIAAFPRRAAQPSGPQPGPQPGPASGSAGEAR